VIDPASHGDRTVLVVGSLAISGAAGKLDLGNSDLIAQNSSASAISGLAATGYNDGSWNGNGIDSAGAAADSTHLTALAVIQNSVTGLASGSALYSIFDNVPSTSADVLVKYTYYGDTNLDGKVDGSDYGRIDNGYLDHLTGWYNGDFNYDGVVDGSDYTLIDNAFNVQGAILATVVANPTAAIDATSAVPEPASLGVMLIGAAGLLGRRRLR